MANVWGAGDVRGEPADRDDATFAAELLQERQRFADLGRRGAAVRGLGARMCGNDVPAERVELELLQRAPHDRRGRLRRASTGHEALGRERDPRDAGAAIARRLADEEQLRRRVLLEVRADAVPPELGAVPVPVEVERVPDPRGRKPGDEPLRR
jgi:hypothetical protein